MEAIHDSEKRSEMRNDHAMRLFLLFRLMEVLLLVLRGPARSDYTTCVSAVFLIFDFLDPRARNGTATRLGNHKKSEVPMRA